MSEELYRTVIEKVERLYAKAVNAVSEEFKQKFEPPPIVHPLWDEMDEEHDAFVERRAVACLIYSTVLRRWVVKYDLLYLMTWHEIHEPTFRLIAFNVLVHELIHYIREDWKEADVKKTTDSLTAKHAKQVLKL